MAVKNSATSSLQLDLSQLTAIQAIRAALGLGIPLFLGLLTNNLVVGVSLAGGAASLAGVGLNSTYHSRVRVMLMACVGVALSAFVGSVTSPIAPLSVLVAGVWGIIAGLLVSYGQSGLVVGLQLALAMIILSHFALEPVNAVLQAALMFAGALLQTVLAVIPLPLQRSAAERMVLANVYRQLAAYIRSSEEQPRPPVREALQKAHTTLSSISPRSYQGKIFVALLEEAERLRLKLIILTRLAQSLQTTSPESDPPLDESLTSLFEAIGSRLEVIADDLKVTGRFIRKNKAKLPVKKALANLRNTPFPPGSAEIVEQILSNGVTLRDQLHRAGKLARGWKYHSKIDFDELHLPPAEPFRWRDTWSILTSNLSLQSPVFRHALRLGVTLALATALYRFTSLSTERGYWIPLTALLVLRPDFKTTITRGVARMLGTMLGAVITGLLVVWLAPPPGLTVILITLMAYLAFSVLFASYALFSVFITVEVVFLLTLVIPQPLETVAYRTLDTAIGGGLALMMYILWPTWEHLQLNKNLAACLNKTRNYFDAIIQAYANPESYDEMKIQELRQESRLAYTNASASLDRARQEPASHKLDPESGQGLLEVRDKFIQSVLILEAYLRSNPGFTPIPEAVQFGEKVDEVLEWCSEALAGEGHKVTSPPDLHEALHALRRVAKTPQLGSDLPIEPNVQILLIEAKKIVQYLGTMQQLSSNKLQAQAKALSTT